MLCICPRPSSLSRGRLLHLLLLGLGRAPRVPKQRVRRRRTRTKQDRALGLSTDGRAGRRIESRRGGQGKAGGHKQWRGRPRAWKMHCNSPRRVSKTPSGTPPRGVIGTAANGSFEARGGGRSSARFLGRRRGTRYDDRRIRSEPLAPSGVCAPCCLAARGRQAFHAGPNSQY